jgi:hypothetical protein
MDDDHERLLRDVYAAFNRRDIDAAVAVMHADVDWPNAFEGGRVTGHEEVRAYWTRPFAQVHQLVRALDGSVLADSEVKHVYTLRDGLVARMEVIEE